MFLYKEFINLEDAHSINLYKDIEKDNTCIIADYFNYTDINTPCFHSFFIGQMVNEYILVLNSKDFQILLDIDYNKKYIILLDRNNVRNHVNYVNINQEPADIKHQIREILNNEKL